MRRRRRNTRSARNGQSSKPGYTRLWKRASPRARGLLKRFWGVRNAPSIKLISGKLPGIGKNSTLVGLGQSPAVTIADGPKNRHTKIVRKIHHGQLVTNARGKRLFILTGKKPPGGKLRFIGYAPQTEYVPYKGVETAGSFKKGKHWIHRHDDAGGRWPKVYMDQNGNYVYATGSYKIGKWIEK